MDIGAVDSAAGAGELQTGRRASGVDTASADFASSLLSQQQLAAARDVLATLPPPIVYTLRSTQGSVVDSVDRLFEVLQDGSFEPPDGPLGGPATIIGATARAAQYFDSPAEMWDAMRTMVGTTQPIADAVAFKQAELTDTEPPPEVANAAQAYAILGGSLPDVQLSWWEAALRYFLLPFDGKFVGNV